jgi:hypothetical protein
MLTTIIDRIKRLQVDASPEEAALLAQLTPDFDDPQDLRRQLAAFEETRAADDAQWERLDRQHNPRAFLEQKAIAERRPHLQAQIDALPPKIRAAEKRRAAFLELTRLFAEVDEAITAEAATLYDRAFKSTIEERRAQFVVLDGLLRLRGHLVAALAAVSRAPRFRRRAPDPLGAYRQTLLDYAGEIDRFRTPGGAKTAVPWPAGAQELLAVLASKGASR